MKEKKNLCIFLDFTEDIIQFLYGAQLIHIKI